MKTTAGIALAIAMTAAPGVSAAPKEMAAPTAAGDDGNSIGLTRFGSYYEDHANVTCTATINCILKFASSPQKKDVLIKTVSCRLQAANAPTSLTLNAPPKSGLGYNRELVLDPSNYIYAKDTYSGNYLYYININSPANFVMQNGTQLYLNFYTSGSAAYSHGMNCTIIGQISE
jgi:hypothetical protein